MRKHVLDLPAGGDDRDALSATSDGAGNPDAAGPSSNGTDEAGSSITWERGSSLRSRIDSGSRAADTSRPTSMQVSPSEAPADDIDLELLASQAIADALRPLQQPEVYQALGLTEWPTLPVSELEEWMNSFTIVAVGHSLDTPGGSGHESNSS